jgi:hypothetical protein
VSANWGLEDQEGNDSTQENAQSIEVSAKYQLPESAKLLNLLFLPFSLPTKRSEQSQE